ncbi:MAG TPA: hypothetical protein VGF55_22245 [Gemmataceae bacterium]|jgi:uncharacterized repeat protein (TIGR01451 family)
MNTLLLTALLPLGCGEGTMPPPPPAPLLFVRVVAPDGTKVVFRPATPEPRVVAAPAVAGFRPGYGYRILLADLPDQPGRVLSPSFEVLSTLHVPPGVRAEDFPATVVFSVDDLRRAAAGGLVTKVVYLEDPFQAPPVRSSPVQPVEFDVLPGHDPLEEARLRGRPVMIVRLGERDVPPAELNAIAIPGTVFVPGDAGLSPPAVPPTLPAARWLWFDPILGPKKPLEEILSDGGDIGPRIGLDPAGQLGGLDPTDTAAEYRYGNGPRRVVISNRVCLFAPRFAVLRQETQPAGEAAALVPAGTEVTLGQAMLLNRERSDWFWTSTAPNGLVSKLGVRGTQSRIWPGGVERIEGVAATGSVEGVAFRGTVVEVAAATQVNNCCRPDQPLVVTKYADPKTPNVGDVVTFVLKYENYGARPIRDVVIADSLASRLEYVPGSAQTDRPTVFTIQANEAYSAVLRWGVKGEVLPGQGGMIRFQARVR